MDTVFFKKTELSDYTKQKTENDCAKECNQKAMQASQAADVFLQSKFFVE